MPNRDTGTVLIKQEEGHQSSSKNLNHIDGVEIGSGKICQSWRNKSIKSDRTKESNVEHEGEEESGSKVNNLSYKGV